MENVKLQPLKPGVKIEEIKTKENQFSSQNVVNFEKWAVLKPLEVIQYMFKVSYQDIEQEKKPLMVGKLDISWRYSMGEFGHLQTHPLEQPVGLNFIKLNQFYLIKTKFNLKPEVNNLYHRELEIFFSCHSKKSIVNEIYVFECHVKNKR